MLDSGVSKIIWQTHEPKYEDLPENFKKVAMTWKNLNPGWDYRYVDATSRADQVRSYSEELYLFYKAMDLVSQADLWRYIVVFQNGGFYADMDSTCIMPLDYVLTKVPDDLEFVSTNRNHADGINNANFGARKNSLILSELLDSIMTSYYLITLFSILQLKEEMSVLEAFQYQLALGPHIYSSTLELFLDRIWSEYDEGVIHSKEIKELRWNPGHMVNYYGERVSYTELVQRNGWSII